MLRFIPDCVWRMYLAANILAPAAYLQSCAHPRPIPPPAKAEAYAEEPPRAPEADITPWDWNTLRFLTVYFDLASDSLRPEDFDSLGLTAMSARGKWACQVDGHASPEGTAEYNLALGARRAHAVGSYLAEFPWLTVREVSYGEEKLVTADPAEYWKNRRVEIRCK